MAKIIAGGKIFKSKTELQKYCTLILKNEKLNKSLDGNSFEVINDVLKLHHNYSEKVGIGNYKIGIRECFINKRNRQFYIIRGNGTNTDFSFYKCISRPSKLTSIKSSLRESIKDQVIKYKEQLFIDNQDDNNNIICQETFSYIKRSNSHLDHYPLHFDTIVYNWLKSININLSDIELLPMQDNKAAHFLKNYNLKKNFYDYHKQNAKYRIVLDKVNLKREKSKVNFK
jgi:hypothetical protein